MDKNNGTAAGNNSELEKPSTRQIEATTDSFMTTKASNFISSTMDEELKANNTKEISHCSEVSSY